MPMGGYPPRNDLIPCPEGGEMAPPSRLSPTELVEVPSRLVTEDTADSEAGSQQTHLAYCKGHSLWMMKFFSMTCLGLGVLAAHSAQGSPPICSRAALVRIQQQRRAFRARHGDCTRGGPSAFFPVFSPHAVFFFAQVKGPSTIPARPRSSP